MRWVDLSDAESTLVTHTADEEALAIRANTALDCASRHGTVGGLRPHEVGARVLRVDEHLVLSLSVLLASVRNVWMRESDGERLVSVRSSRT